MDCILSWPAADLTSQLIDISTSSGADEPNVFVLQLLPLTVRLGPYPIRSFLCMHLMFMVFPYYWKTSMYSKRRPHLWRPPFTQEPACCHYFIQSSDLSSRLSVIFALLIVSAILEFLCPVFLTPLFLTLWSPKFV